MIGVCRDCFDVYYGMADNRIGVDLPDWPHPVDGRHSESNGGARSIPDFNAKIFDGTGPPILHNPSDVGLLVVCPVQPVIMLESDR